MSSVVREWIENWMDNHVHFDGYPSEDTPDPGATMLSQQCVTQANEDGITKEQLEAEVEDLPMHMHRGLQRAADAEAVRQASKEHQ